MRGVLGLLGVSVMVFAGEPYTPQYGPWKSCRMWGGGSMQNVVFCPSDKSRLYTYCDVSGPFRSDDAGKTWYTLEKERASVRALSVDPRNADKFVMLAGRTWWIKGGIYVSHDGGKSIEQKVVTRFYGNDLRRRLGVVLARDPFNPDVLVASSDDDGIWKSVDNGETWTNKGLKNTYPSDLRFDEKIKGRIYYSAPQWGMTTYEKGKDGVYLPAKDRAPIIPGFFVSNDGGETWEKLFDAAPAEIVQSRQFPDRFYGIFEERFIRVSTDGCRTWRDCADNLPIAPAPIEKTIQNGRFNVLSAGPNFIIAGDTNSNLFRLDEVTGKWSRIQYKVDCNDPDAPSLSPARFGKSMGSLIVDPDRPSHWFLTDWYAIWETFDAGQNWTPAIKGVAQVCMFTAFADPGDDKVVYLSMADNGILVSRDGGDGFEHVDAGSQNCFAADAKNGIVYACGGKFHSSISLSRDKGRTWKKVAAKGLPPLRANCNNQYKEATAVYSIAVNPVDSKVYVCISGELKEGKGGVYESVDFGESWTWSGKGLPLGKKDFFGNSEWSTGAKYGELHISPNGDMVCFSSLTGGTYYRPNGEAEWKMSKWQMNGNPAYFAGCPVVADPLVPGRFLGTRKDFLHVSTDGGRTFNRIWGLQGPLGQAVFDNKVRDHVFCTNAEGIWESFDCGETWHRVPGYEHLPSRNLGNRIAFYNGRLYVLTSGSGVFWMKVGK